MLNRENKIKNQKNRENKILKRRKKSEEIFSKRKLFGVKLKNHKVAKFRNYEVTCEI